MLYRGRSFQNHSFRKEVLAELKLSLRANTDFHFSEEACPGLFCSDSYIVFFDFFCWLSLNEVSVVMQPRTGEGCSPSSFSCAVDTTFAFQSFRMATGLKGEALAPTKGRAIQARVNGEFTGRASRFVRFSIW